MSDKFIMIKLFALLAAVSNINAIFFSYKGKQYQTVDRRNHFDEKYDRSDFDYNRKIQIRYKDRSDRDNHRHEWKKNDNSDKDASKNAFKYHEDKVNNVDYYYPNEAVNEKKVNANEISLFYKIGGIDGISKILDRLIYSKLLLDEDMKPVCFGIGLSILKKQLVDFFVALINGGGKDFLEDLVFQYNNISFLKKINMTKFIIYVLQVATEFNVQAEIIGMIKERLNYCQDHTKF